MAGKNVSASVWGGRHGSLVKGSKGNLGRAKEAWEANVSQGPPEEP